MYQKLLTLPLGFCLALGLLTGCAWRQALPPEASPEASPLSSAPSSEVASLPASERQIQDETCQDFYDYLLSGDAGAEGSVFDKLRQDLSISADDIEGLARLHGELIFYCKIGPNALKDPAGAQVHEPEKPLADFRLGAVKPSTS